MLQTENLESYKIKFLVTELNTLFLKKDRNIKNFYTDYQTSNVIINDMIVFKNSIEYDIFYVLSELHIFFYTQIPFNQL